MRARSLIFFRCVGYGSFLTALALAQGCLPFAMDSNRVEGDEHLGFKHDFDIANIRREMKGLPDLDWCSEVYGFSRSWAEALPECKDRVKRFKKGDTTALDAPTLTPVKP